MPALRELQEQFIRNLRSDASDISALLKTHTLSAEEHINIYRSSSIGAKQKVLNEIFPVCHKLVGEEFFLYMIDEYIALTPSLSPDLGEYGEQLAKFILDFSPAKTLPYLSDVALLEWAWHKIFNCADSGTLDFEKLNESISSCSEDIAFALAPGSFLMSSAYPIHRIWEFNQENYAGEDQIALTPNATYFLLVWRQGFEMRMDEVSQSEWVILKWFEQGLTVSEIYTETNSHLPAINFEEVLSILVSKGFLTDFRVRIK